MSVFDDRQREDAAQQQRHAVPAQGVEPVERVAFGHQAADPEHPSEEAAEPAKVADRKDDPGDHQDNRDEDMGQHFMPLVPSQQPFFLNDQQHEKPQTP